MTSIPQKETGPTAAERAEQRLNQTGERIGRLVGLAGLRFQQAAQALREKAAQTGEPGSAPTQTQHAGGSRARKALDNQPTTERAEVLVDQLGQRINQWAMVNGLQARRVMARLREDAEDMWVEAQEKHYAWKSRQRRE